MPSSLRSSLTSWGRSSAADPGTNDGAGAREGPAPISTSAAAPQEGRPAKHPARTVLGRSQCAYSLSMTTSAEMPKRGWPYKARTPEGVTLGHIRWTSDAEAIAWVGPMTRNPARAVVVERYDSERDTWNFVAKVGSSLSR